DRSGRWETPANQPRGRSSSLPYRLLELALIPESRAVLHQRIEARFGIMLNRGLIEEVEQLRTRGDLNPGMPSMRCVGYRQVWEYLDGNFSREELVHKGVAATRQLAKRQLTWLRRWDQAVQLEPDDPYIYRKILNLTELQP